MAGRERKKPTRPPHRRRPETALAAGNSLKPQARCRAQPDWQWSCSLTRIYFVAAFLPLATLLLSLRRVCFEARLINGGTELLFVDLCIVIKHGGESFFRRD